MDTLWLLLTICGMVRRHLSKTEMPWTNQVSLKNSFGSGTRHMGAFTYTLLRLALSR